MPETIDTVVIGAGQAGLCASYELRRRGRDHLVLEKGRVAERWRSQRWDSFTLVTPNWTLRLPNHPYDRDPDGFLPRDEVVRYLERFAEDVDPPLRTGVEVRRVGPGRDGSRFRLDTSDGPLEADQVVVAVGTFQRPRIPDGANGLPDTIRQVPAADYRRPGALPDGAVLVVGSGQSGTQIARELNDGGRRVFLSVGGAPRLPRRYRGADLFAWADRLGLFRRTVDALDDPSERFSPNPHVSGREGGRDVNLHAFARDGVRLLGRFRGARDGRARFAPDLHDSLRTIDQGVQELLAGIDALIEREGLDAPPADPDPGPQDGYRQEQTEELELEAAGIGSVVWATGFAWEFSWLDLPVLDDVGYPSQERGVSPVPGLYFLGLHWLHTLASGLLYGVVDDAEHVVAALDAEAEGG